MVMYMVEEVACLHITSWLGLEEYRNPSFDMSLKYAILVLRDVKKSVFLLESQFFLE